MAKWRLKSPGLFNPYWHELIRKHELGEYLIGEYSYEKNAKAAAYDWRLFMYCLRNWPAHPTHAQLREDLYARRTRISHQHLDIITGPRWRLVLVVSQSKMSLLDEANFLEMPIDNPDETA